jgi:hypothetical protein
MTCSDTSTQKAITTEANNALGENRPGDLFPVIHNFATLYNKNTSNQIENEKDTITGHPFAFRIILVCDVGRKNMEK